MGVGEAAVLSHSYSTRNLKESVSWWLEEGCRGAYSLDKSSGYPWLAPQPQCKKDIDQSSVASVDDSASVSDSTHESYSSDSSAHTSWTTATDHADVFPDEDEKGQLQFRKDFFESCTSIELQDQDLRGLHNKNQTCGGSRSSFVPSNTVGNIKARTSTNLRPEVTGPVHSLSQVLSRPAVEIASQPPTSDIRSECLLQKCNNRRVGCSGKNSCPPQLRRDTETTDHFVSLLIVFATRLITAIWPLSACPPMMSTCFNGAGVLPLRVFIQETLRRSKTSYSTLQVALYYLVMLKAKLPSGDFTKEQPRPQLNGESSERSQCRAMQCGRRMFLSALMLASKYLQDRNYSARAWSKISGLRSNEINENEREYLAHIDYNLHVPKDTFDNWSKIVLALSKLSKEEPQLHCRPDSSNLNFLRPEGGTSTALADMVSQVDLDQMSGQHTFSTEWWSELIHKLDPSLAKDSALTDEFLRGNLPKGHVDHQSTASYTEKPFCKLSNNPPMSSEAPPRVYDINFSESLKPRSTEQSMRPQTPQTPVQLSPARSSMLPMQPHLRNLPTPQSTPKIAEGCQWLSGYGRPSLRCSASMDALRNMRRQCIMNANLERCPPPRPQCHGLPSVRSLIRPAETIREIPSRSATPLTSSPGSVTSESTTCTSRSRSSSISSNSSLSSWSSTVPRLRHATSGLFSSPLSRISSLSDRHCNLASTTCQRLDPAVMKFYDEGYGSGEEPHIKLSKHSFSTSSEVEAVQVLMSLSSQSEASSQSATPTPQRFTSQGVAQTSNGSYRGHKRTLSKTDHNLQPHVRNAIVDEGISIDVVEDDVLPYYCITPRQCQQPSKSWASWKTPVPNRMDNKRLAAYGAIQQFASAPDLASQYLKDQMIAVS